MAGLTEQQSKALQLDKHIALTANAGSGKTRVLVERYVAAVLSGVRVEQILCLTFTEKAALELRQKIGDRINAEWLAARREHPEHAALLRDAKIGMIEANISTIHSFCSRLLREFPVEAEIDANFKVLEDFDASSLKVDACEDAVREFLAKERSESVGGAERRVHDVLVGIGYRKVSALLVELLGNREKIEHARMAGKNLTLDEKSVRLHWSSLARTAAEVVTLNVKKTKGDFSGEVSALTDALGDESLPVDRILEKLSVILRDVLTTEGLPRKRGIVFEGGAKYSYDDALSILQTAYLSLKEMADGHAAVSLNPYLRTLGTLAELYGRSEENYDRRKRTIGALDFDDLQILAVRLLNKSGSVRNALVSRFRHVMVDEFQDTNFLQYRIFLGLLDDLHSDSRLFVVGDPKQSIYRFRNAQVEVSAIAGQNISRLSDGLALPLSESFRMNAGVASFVNHIFPEILKANNAFDIAGISCANQANYNPLVARRPHGTSDPVEIFIKEKRGGDSEDSGQQEGGGDESTSAEAQAEFTAARIREMVDSREKIKSARENEREREVNYGDIAILLRTRSKLALLEDSLTGHGIPYVVSAGIGFYSAQEIFDLTNYLTFLLDSSADVPLLTILRSPFFGISENELYQVSQVRGKSLFERFVRFSNSPDAGAEVRYAASVLAEEMRIARRQTIPELLNRILERTGWLGAFRASPTADQRIANLRKLLDIAREFEARGFNSLYDFVQRIKYLKETAREGQAPVEESADAVRIMTVHAAKGLEFPVVFLPFCDMKSRGGTGVLVNDRVGILPFVGNQVPAALELYKRFENMNEQAELVRLFYVACTRAMDKLILTTSAKKMGRAMISFADLLAKTLDISAVSPEGRIDIGELAIKVHHKVPELSTRTPRKIAASHGIGEFFLGAIPADIDGEIYSATVLQTFRLCPTRYFLRYRLGMPVSYVKTSFDENAENNDSILSTVKGELVHAVLEQVIGSGTSDAEAIESSAAAAVSTIAEGGLTDGERTDLTRLVAENARNALTTLSHISGGGNRYVEQTVTRKFDSDYLTGTLDLLVEDERGFHIYDYKTNKLVKSEEEIYAGYEIQMKLYASLCGKLRPDQNEFDVTIVFTRQPDKYLRKSYSKQDLSDFEQELSDMLRKMKSIEPEVGNFPAAGSLPTSTPHCPECEYFLGEGKKKCLLSRE